MLNHASQWRYIRKLGGKKSLVGYTQLSGKIRSSLMNLENLFSVGISACHFVQA